MKNNGIREKNSDIWNFLVDDFYRRCVSCLFQSTNFQESLVIFYDCLKKYMPITSLTYMSSYTRQKAFILSISDQGVRVFDTSAPLSLQQVENVYYYRDVFSKENKGIWITDLQSEYARHLDNLNPDLGLEPPYLYFFTEENGNILGSMFFGCDAAQLFNPEQRALLDVLRDPLFFLMRTHTLFQEMENLLDLTRKLPS